MDGSKSHENRKGEPISLVWKYYAYSLIFIELIIA
jgi:hypothetical protein